MPINEPPEECIPASVTGQQLSAAMLDASNPLLRGMTAAFREAAHDVTCTESELERALASGNPGTATSPLQAGAAESASPLHLADDGHSHSHHIDVLRARRRHQLIRLQQLAALFHHATHRLDVTCAECTDTLAAFSTARVAGVVWIGGLATEIDVDAQGRFYVTATNPGDGQRCDVGNGMYDTLRDAVTAAEAYILGEVDDAVAEYWSRFPPAVADAVVCGGELWEVFAVDPDGMISIGDFTYVDRCDRARLSELWPASPLVTLTERRQAEDLGLRHEHGYLYRSAEGIEIDRIDEDDIGPGQRPWYLSIPAEPGEADERPHRFPFAVFADALFVVRLYLDGRALDRLLEAQTADDGPPRASGS